MIYVTSDLHGIAPAEFQALLSLAPVTDRDTLYVLGDVIDRGDYGVELLTLLSGMENVQLLAGNHEAMLLSCAFLFEEVTEDSLSRLDAGRLALLSNWLANGAEPTLKGLRELRNRDPELLEGILEDLRDAPLYDVVEANGKTFLLTHAGLGHFAPDKRLSEYTADEFLWTRPTLSDRYFAKTRTVFGHTPVSFFGQGASDRALHTETWSCIDTGSGHGGKPMLLRLEDMKEFYLP